MWIQIQICILNTDPNLHSEYGSTKFLNTGTDPIQILNTGTGKYYTKKVIVKKSMM